MRKSCWLLTVIFNKAVNCWLYSAEEILMDKCGTLKGKWQRKNRSIPGGEGDQSQCHFVYHKSHMTLVFKPGPPRWPAAVAMVWNVAANGNSILSTWINAVARALTQVSYQQLRILSQTPRKDRTNKHYSWTLLAYPPAQETPSNTKREGSSPPQQNPSLYCIVNQFNSSQTALSSSLCHT